VKSIIHAITPTTTTFAILLIAIRHQHDILRDNSYATSMMYPKFLHPFSKELAFVIIYIVILAGV
jgi:hypothetical protein